MTISITRRINIEPKFLTKNLHAHLLTKLRSTIINECTKEYGFILDIVEITSINDNNDTAFTVTFDAETLLPSVGSIYLAKVTMISPEGIFVIVQNKLRIFVPKDHMCGYKYQEMPTKTYKLSENEIIQVDSIVQISILAVIYERKNFRSFAKLVI